MKILAPISGSALARRLKPYEIRPRKSRRWSDSWTSASPPPSRIACRVGARLALALGGSRVPASSPRTIARLREQGRLRVSYVDGACS